MIQNKIITADYIIDKDGKILGEDYVLGDASLEKIYFNQNKEVKKTPSRDHGKAFWISGC